MTHTFTRPRRLTKLAAVPLMALLTTAVTATNVTAAAAPAQAASQTASPCKSALAGTTTRTAPGAGKTVALTFDDSQSAYMTQIMQVLRKYNVRATFFNVGKFDAGMPSVLKSATADGHLVEPHTWEHAYPTKANGYWSPAYLKDQINRTAAQQRAATGKASCFFRPPGGHRDNVAAVTKALGLQNVLWNVDTQDWSQPAYQSRAAQDQIVRKGTDLRYANPSHPIVLMHAGKASNEPESKVHAYRGNTVTALPRIIEWYKARGYRFVAMDGTSGLNATALKALPMGSGHGFTADARPDLLTVTARGDLNLYAGTGTGYVTAPRRIATSWNQFTAVLATDWSGDRRADLLARNRAGELFQYQGDGNGGLTGSILRIGAGWNMYDTILAPGDVTGDGKPDLLGRTPSGQLNLYRGSGSSKFASGAIKVGTGYQRYTQLLTPGDFTGDRKVDLIGRTREGKLWLLAGNGNGTFAAPRAIGSGWNMFSRILSAGDVTGDGRPDVIGITLSGKFYVYNGAGTGLRPGVLRGSGWNLPTVIGAP